MDKHKRIGYAYIENSEVYYHIHLTDALQIKLKTKLGENLLNFAAMDSTTIFRYLRDIEKSIYDMMDLKNDKHEPINVGDMYLATKNVIEPYLESNVLLFVYGLIYIRFISELPFDYDIALENYRLSVGVDEESDWIQYVKDMGCSRDFEILTGLLKGSLKNIIIIKSEGLKADLDLILDKKQELQKFTTLQRLYLLNNDDTLGMNYLNTSFFTTLRADAYVKGDNSSEIIEAVRTGKSNIYEMYDIQNMDDWYRFEMIHMVMENIIFKPCKYCGGYFIPTGRSDSEYCNRIIFGEEKSCKEIGAIKIFKRKHKNDEIHKAYKKAYARMDSRKRSKSISVKEFNAWSYEARTKREECASEQITFEQYQEWLDSSRR